jgi:hypothetical protein
MYPVGMPDKQRPNVKKVDSRPDSRSVKPNCCLMKVNSIGKICRSAAFVEYEIQRMKPSSRDTAKETVFPFGTEGAASTTGMSCLLNSVVVTAFVSLVLLSQAMPGSDRVSRRVRKLDCRGNADMIFIRKRW